MHGFPDGHPTYHCGADLADGLRSLQQLLCLYGLNAQLRGRLNSLRQVSDVHGGEVQRANVALSAVSGQHLGQLVDEDVVVHLCLRQLDFRLDEVKIGRLHQRHRLCTHQCTHTYTPTNAHQPMTDDGNGALTEPTAVVTIQLVVYLANAAVVPRDDALPQLQDDLRHGKVLLGCL